MKKLIWFVTGVSLGYLASKQIAENPKAQALVADARDRAKAFGAAVSEGFREREAELSADVASKPVKPSTSATKTAAAKPAAKSASK